MPESDPEQPLLSISEDFVQSPSHKAASTGAVDLDGVLQPPGLQLHEDLSEGNGGQAWPAGLVLAKYMLRMRRTELAAACTIVELGAGSGLVGLAVALGCDSTTTTSDESSNGRPMVLITDQTPMVPLMQRNITLNGLEHRVEACTYDWGGARPPQISSSPDMVLAADCVYFEPAFPLLLRTLDDLLGPDTTCFFCFKKRRRADMHFLKAARKAFAVEEVQDDCDRETYSRENIFLCTIRRKVSNRSGVAD